MPKAPPGFSRHLYPQHDAIFAELLDTLHLDRLDHPRLEFGILGEFQPDALDQLTRELDIRVIADGDVELVGNPVAALVLDGAKLAEGDREQRPAMVPKLDRTRRSFRRFPYICRWKCIRRLGRRRPAGRTCRK